MRSRSFLQHPTWLLVPALLALPFQPAVAQEHGHEMEENGLKAQYLSDLETLESKFNELADAMGSDQYSWRPMEGVRSVSEVFMLIVAENYVVPAAWDAEPPEGMEVSNALFRTLPEVTDKGEVLEHLRKSFEYYKHAVAAIPDETMHSTIRFFGQERSVSESLFLIAADMHEHLGQAIAYARSNHVVPPWTARAQANRE